MNNSLILILAILIASGVGAYLGMLFTKLKSKSEKSMLEAEQSQLINTIAELKATLVKIENEREHIRSHIIYNTL